MTTPIQRRAFLKQLGIGSSTLAIGAYFASCQTVIPEPEGVIELFKPNIDEIAKGIGLNPYLFIEPSGLITLFAHKPEMGQGTYQSIPLLIAEELGVSLKDVQIKLPPASSIFKEQNVGGSSSVRTMWEPMRKIGAAAREMLVQAAANQWQISPKDCEVKDGKVHYKGTEKMLSYGDLVEAASKIAIPENPKLKEAKEYQLIGKKTMRSDIPLKVSGQANFGIDMKVAGMVYAVIERSPTFSGKINAFNEQEVLAVEGVQKVLKCIRPVGMHQWEGVAVVADSYWAALQGRKILQVDWEESATLPSTAGLFQTMRQKASEKGLVDTQLGDFERTYETAKVRLTADYETPFLAHAPMEPMNTLAHVQEDGCEIWTAVQFPGWVQAEAAAALKIDKEKVTVHCPFMGGSFGRKGFPDFSMEGVLLSQQLKKPVKIIWTRADDMQQGPFRTGSLNRLSGGLDETNKLLAFQHKVIAPSYEHSLRGASQTEKIDPPWIMEPIGKPFYDTPNFSSRYVWVDATPIPLMWWRSVYSSTNVFGQECFMDELATEAGINPVDFRLQMLENQPKYKQLLIFLRDKAAWNQPLPDNWGRGIAITHCFESTAGQVIEVSKNNGQIKIERVVTAIDCGIALNPDNVKAQCEGSVIMGLTAALKDGLTFENGRVKESNFHDYRVLRITETPKMETFILPSNEPPTGVGEPALPTVAPALANAIFDLTGKRFRKLPIDLEDI